MTDADTLAAIITMCRYLDADKVEALVKESEQGTKFLEEIAPIVAPHLYFDPARKFMVEREELIAKAARHILKIHEIAKEIEELERRRHQSNSD